MMWVSVAFAVVVTFLYGRGAMSLVLSTMDQTVESTGSLQQMANESKLFASHFNRKPRTTSESSVLLGRIDLGDSVTLELGEDLPYFTTCAERRLLIDVGMSACQSEPVLLCITDTATGTALGSLSSDLASVHHSDLPIGDNLELVLRQMLCDTTYNDRNMSGVGFAIRGKYHLLGSSNVSSVTLYAGRFPACNATMLKLATEAGKTVTVRTKACSPPPTTSTAPTAKYTPLETTTERTDKEVTRAQNTTKPGITLSKLTTPFSVTTTTAPADTNIDIRSGMIAEHVAIVTLGGIVIATLMVALILAIRESRRRRHRLV